MSPTYLFGFMMFVVVVLLQQDANAYLDPSSGSILIQILLGGVAGFAVLMRIYWRKIRRYLGFYKPLPDEDAKQQDRGNDES